MRIYYNIIYKSTYKKYENICVIFTILQGAGIIKFKTTSYERRSDGTILPPQMIVYEVNDKASDEWLEKEDNE